MAHIEHRCAPDVGHTDRCGYPERSPTPEDPFGVLETNINMCTSNAARDIDPVMRSWLMRTLPCPITH